MDDLLEGVRSSWGRAFGVLAVHHHSTEEMLTVIGWLVVLGCVIGAIYYAVHERLLAVGLLLLVAIVAAFLLLA